MVKIESKISLIEGFCIFGSMILLVALIFNSDFITSAYISGDMVDGHYAVWSSMAKIWNDGEIPLWNPYYWGGFSSVGHIFGVFYPILFILQKIFWNPVTETLSYSILPMYIAIHIAIFSAGIYCLNRVVGYRKSIALPISLFATFAGCTLSNAGWAYIFGGIFWLPFLITFLYLMYKSCKQLNCYVFLSGLVFGLIILCSTSHGSVMAVIVYAMFFFTALWQNRKNSNAVLKIMIKQISSGFIGLLLGAVELIPFFFYYNRSYRFTETVSTGVNNQLSIQAFTEHSVDNFNMNTIFGGYSGFWAINIVFLLLIIVGFFKINKNKEIMHQFSKTVFLWAIFYTAAIGIPDIVWYIPFANGIRQPHLYIPFIAIGGSLLAASGLEVIFNCCINKEKFENEVFHKNAMLMMCMFAFSVAIMQHNVRGKLDFIFKILVAIITLSLLIPRGTNSKCIRVYFSCSMLILSIINIMLYMRLNTDRFYVKDAESRVEHVNEVIDRALEEVNANNQLENTNGRILQWGSPNSYPTNTAGMLGYFDCGAYINPVYEKNAVNHLLQGNLLKRSQLQNINYILVSEQSSAEFQEWISDVFRGTSVRKLNNSSYSDYNNENLSNILVYDIGDIALGTAWFTNQVCYYNSEIPAEEIYTQINDSSTDLSQKVFVNKDYVEHESDMLIEKRSNNQYVEIKSYTANTIELYVETDTNSILSTSEIFYPGWKVFVDGEEREVLEINYAFRGTFVEKGKHNIKFVYFPTDFVVGAIAGVIGCIIMTCGLGYGIYSYCNNKRLKIPFLKGGTLYKI